MIRSMRASENRNVETWYKLGLTYFTLLHDTCPQMHKFCSDLLINPTDQDIEFLNRDRGLEELQISVCRL
jgi:hypothetical protein